MICGHQREDDCGCVQTPPDPKPPEAPKVWDECSKGWHEWSYGKCLRCGKDILPKPAPAPEPKQRSEEPIDWEKAELWAAGTAQGDARLSQVQAARAFLALLAEVETFRKDAQYWKNQVKDLEGDRAELAAAREEIAAIKRQAEDATEYVLAVDNRELRKEIEGLRIRVGEYEDMTEINKREGQPL